MVHVWITDSGFISSLTVYKLYDHGLDKWFNLSGPQFFLPIKCGNWGLDGFVEATEENTEVQLKFLTRAPRYGSYQIWDLQKTKLLRKYLSPLRLWALSLWVLYLEHQNGKARRAGWDLERIWQETFLGESCILIRLPGEGCSGSASQSQAWWEGLPWSLSENVLGVPEPHGPP